LKKTIVFILLILIGCEDKIEPEHTSELIIIANEGNYGDGNGSINVFDGDNLIQTISNIGDVVQSILAYNNKLFVLSNNSHTIKRFSISNSGLALPGIEVSTNNSSPREMVILNNKLYFTNWNTKDIKVLNLETFLIEQSLPINGIPEDIVTDGEFLWVSCPNINLYDKNNGTSIIKIDPLTLQIINRYIVGRGPQNMIIDQNRLLVSRSYYDDAWKAFYGTSSIDLINNEVIIIEYGASLVCGGDIMKVNQSIYRTFDGGVAPVNPDLSLNRSLKIGTFNNLYSAGSNIDWIFLGVSDYVAPDTVMVHNSAGELIYNHVVDVLPGDYIVWTKN